MAAIEIASGKLVIHVQGVDKFFALARPTKRPRAPAVAAFEGGGSPRAPALAGSLGRGLPARCSGSAPIHARQASRRDRATNLLDRLGQCSELGLSDLRAQCIGPGLLLD